MADTPQLLEKYIQCAYMNVCVQRTSHSQCVLVLGFKMKVSCRLLGGGLDHILASSGEGEELD